MLTSLSVLHKGTEVCCSWRDKPRCAVVEGLKIKRRLGRVPCMMKDKWTSAERYDGQLTGIVPCKFLPSQA